MLGAGESSADPRESEEMNMMGCKLYLLGMTDALMLPLMLDKPTSTEIVISLIHVKINADLYFQEIMKWSSCSSMFSVAYL